MKEDCNGKGFRIVFEEEEGTGFGFSQMLLGMHCRPHIALCVAVVELSS